MHIAAFVGLSILITIAPGPDFALVTRNSLRHGRRGAVETGLGIRAGVTLWVVACGAGIAAIVRNAPGLFLAFKITGAGYLTYLGASALWSSRGAGAVLHVAGVVSKRQTLWLQGFASTSLNPKFGAFVVVFFPEFIDKSKSVLPQTALLGAIYLVIDLVWMIGVGMAVAAVGESLMSEAVRRWLQRTCGVALLFFAVLLITTSSR